MSDQKGSPTLAQPALDREQARDLVFDLVSATNDWLKRSGDKYYAQQYEEARDAVINALVAAQPPAAPVETKFYAAGGDGTFDENDEPGARSSAAPDWKQDQPDTSVMPRKAAPVEKPDWCQGADAVCHHPACACVIETGPVTVNEWEDARSSAGTDAPVACMLTWADGDVTFSRGDDPPDDPEAARVFGAVVTPLYATQPQTSSKTADDAIKALTGLFSILRGKSYARDHYQLEVSHGLYNELRDVRDRLVAERGLVVTRPERATAVSQGKPVAWRCKDYADGWIVYQDEAPARKYAEDTGCLIQPLYLREAR